MFIILTLIIIVAAFNIVTGMTILVKNKTKEIAIFNTLGMSKFSISKIFFIIGSFIGVTGTIFGVVLGIVFAHNIETVPRIFKRIRPGFKYEKSLGVITAARDFGLVTKSNLILGMGEEIAEVHQALTDLHEAGCDLVTITQYLRPSLRHHPVDRWVRPEEFVELAKVAEEIGFAGVLSGPLVRSSYRAGKLYKQAIAARNSTDV